MPQDEVDEIEVYGSEAQSGTQLATYSFEVRLGKAVGIHPLTLPDHCCVHRCVTACSTLDPVPTLLWASLPSSLKRYKGAGTVGKEPGGGMGGCVLTLLCSFRTVLSQTWRLWFAPVTGKMGPCQCCRYVKVGVGDSWYNMIGLSPHSYPIFILEEYPAPGGDNL